MSDLAFVPLLPAHSSSIEQQLEQVAAASMDLPVVRLWSADDCPVALLPWLASALSVDVWQSNWPEQIKRAAIRDAVDVHTSKGTIYAVKAALAALGYEARVVEWHQNAIPGDPFTYELYFDQRQVPALLTDLDRAIEAVDATKSLRSHMITVKINAVSDAGPTTGIVTVIGNKITSECTFSGVLFNSQSVVI